MYRWVKRTPEAIKAVFPDVCIQNCIVHQIRNSIECVSYKNRKEFMKYIKLVYTGDIDESLRKFLYLATD